MFIEKQINSCLSTKSNKKKICPRITLISRKKISVIREIRRQKATL